MNLKRLDKENLLSIWIKKVFEQNKLQNGNFNMLKSIAWQDYRYLITTFIQSKYISECQRGTGMGPFY
jgi:hypothetical protein